MLDEYIVRVKKIAIMDNMKKVGILRGGDDEYYNSSLKEGSHLFSHIYEKLSGKYQPVDIFVDRSGLWHLKGMPVTPEELVHKVDVVWNTSHPSFSEIFRSLAIPHITTPAFALNLGKKREMLREHLKQIGINVPRSIVLPLYQKDFDGPKEAYAKKKAMEIFEKFSSPWVVKSYTEEKNMAIHLAKTFPELVRAIEDGIAHGKSILVEEFVSGKASALHTLSDFRKDEVYVFPPKDSAKEEKEKLVNLARELHKHLGVEHYLKADFVLHPRMGIYITEISFSPDLREGSHFDEVYRSVGAESHHIIEHILEKALNRS
jgi:D-alanine-D-alanine ligase-like ATP-grasp enzyme